MKPEEREAALLELAARRDWTFAFLIVSTFQLVAEKYPEELRAAIAKAFDLSGYEDELKRLRRQYQKALAAINELQTKLAEQTTPATPTPRT